MVKKSVCLSPSVWSTRGTTFSKTGWGAMGWPVAMGGEGRLSPHRPHPPTPAPVFLKVPSRQHQAPLSQKHAPMHILSGCLVQAKRRLLRKVLSGVRQTLLLEKPARVLGGGPPAEPGPAHHFRPASSAIDIGRGAGQESEKYIYQLNSAELFLSWW